MKFTQFLINNMLAEDINMTQYRNVINQCVIDSIDHLLDIIPSYKRKIDADIKNDATQGEYHELLYFIKPLINRSITSILRLGLTRVINNEIPEVNKKVLIVFKDINADGTAFNFKITLNNKFPRALTDMLVKTIGNWLVKHNKQNTNKFKTLFEINSEKLKQYYDFTNIPVVYEMVSIILHELTHVIQDVRQAHRGGETEYRSYLTKNPIFNGILKKMYKGDKLTDEEYQIYFSSPQEIAAHAHNIAADVIKNIGDNKPTAQDIQKAVKDLVGDFLSDRNDPRIAKVYNRYLKLVYQQVMNHFV
jgi:hypothetical protein